MRSRRNRRLCGCGVVGGGGVGSVSFEMSTSVLVGSECRSLPVLTRFGLLARGKGREPQLR